jgi:hypothetical protein
MMANRFHGEPVPSCVGVGRITEACLARGEGLVRVPRAYRQKSSRSTGWKIGFPWRLIAFDAGA